MAFKISSSMAMSLRFDLLSGISMEVCIDKQSFTVVEMRFASAKPFKTKYANRIIKKKSYVNDYII